jgi:DNA-binding transcriptional LysR family regulator
MITLDRLRYFVEVATREHVGQASKALHVSPSVISSAIASLEEEFQCELFLRENNRLKLNERGSVLLNKAKELLDQTQALYHDVASSPVQLKGHFKLGASHFLMQEYLVPAYLELKKAHPDLTVEFASLDSGVAVSQVLSGGLDAALVFRSSYYHELEETLLYSGEFNIVVKSSHPILKASKKSIMAELNSLPAITFRTSAGPNFWENHPAFKSIGLIPAHAFFYEDTQTATQLLAKTNGWAFLPDLIVRKNKNLQKVSVGKELSAPVNVSMIRHKNLSAKSGMGRSVLDQLTAHIKVG